MKLDRYSRQVLFKEISEKGQRKLLDSKVLIVGCGALGGVLCQILARAGVGHLRIVDRDYVELENLQRQLLFDEDDVRENLPKAIAAQRRIKKINSDIKIDARVADANSQNIETLLKDVDLVLDGTDNFETRLLINDASCKHSKPWIYGACVSSYGMLMPVIPGETACFRCFVSDQPDPARMPTCDTAGILGSIPAVIASLQATEAMKYLVGKKDKMNLCLVTIDAWSGQFKSFRMNRDRNCSCCQKKNYEFLDSKKVSLSFSLCGRNAVHLQPGKSHRINLEDLKKRLSAYSVTTNKFLLKFKIQGYEIVVFPDGRAILKGTTDLSKARSLYAKYVGM